MTDRSGRSLAGRPSPTDLLVLHGVRVLGFASAAAVAARTGVDPAVVDELLLDEQACGTVSFSSFHDLSGWSLTERGRAENERRLAAELEATGAREVVAAAYESFLPLNTRLLEAMTRWQLRPQPGEPLAANDHTDWRWDERVIESLGLIGRSLTPLCDGLVGVLSRFDGYAGRYAAALARAEAGQRGWVDATGRDSCHVVWMQLHEDLVATLGVQRT